VEEEIRGRYPHSTIRLIEGSGGVFVVTLDGSVIYSKKELIGCRSSRFPEPGEIGRLIAEHLGQ